MSPAPAPEKPVDWPGASALGRVVVGLGGHRWGFGNPRCSQGSPAGLHGWRWTAWVFTKLYLSHAANISCEWGSELMTTQAKFSP